jgi:hypothetical protein
MTIPSVKIVQIPDVANGRIQGNEWSSYSGGIKGTNFHNHPLGTVFNIQVRRTESFHDAQSLQRFVFRCWEVSLLAW